MSDVTRFVGFCLAEIAALGLAGLTGNFAYDKRWWRAATSLSAALILGLGSLGLFIFLPHTR